jgi:hypothetical protein
MTRPVGRRDFLRSLSLAAGGGLLAGCAATVAPPLGRTAGAVSLDEFLALSRLLTGVTDLAGEHGQAYLASLDEAGRRELVGIIEGAGFRTAAPPASLEALQRTGVLASTSAQALADKLLIAWYTGFAEGPSGPRVATYTGALAWRALGYTKPPGVCGGGVDYWEGPPPGPARA